MTSRKSFFYPFFILLVGAGLADAQESSGGNADLAKKLSNPIASLISVPIQFNYDHGYGPDGDGDKVFANVQPVIPFTLSDNLSLVTRTIVPVVWQSDVASAGAFDSGEQFGLGDTQQSFFFVPKSQDTSLGTLTWGAGPAIGWPTSTDRLLGSGTMGLGPTGVFLFQEGPWTYGMLGGHQWGIWKTRDMVSDLNNTFFQPFLSYSTPSAWTFGLNTEGAYNWTAEDWSLPINATISKLTSIGGQRVQFQAGLRYWADSPDNGPDGVGARFGITFLFPK